MSNTKRVFLPIMLLLLLGTALHPFRSNPIYITQSDSYHIVQRGETLYSISRRHSIPVEDLRLYNNLDSDRIFVGQKIYLTPSVQAKNEYVTIRPIPEEGFHTVQRGETVYRISKMYDLQILDILEYNQLETFDIQAGQKIWLVPGMVEGSEIAEETVVAEGPVDPEEQDIHDLDEEVGEVAGRPVPETGQARTPAGEYHTVQAGENLYRISLRYGMTVDELKKMNNLTTDEIHVGQRLAIAPGAGPVPRPPAERPDPPRHVMRRNDLHVPVNGRVVSEFGIRNGIRHNGIDIAAPLGEPIHAVLSGKVAFAGTQRGYGNIIVLEHKDYVATVYAHLERCLVRLGEEVRKGQPIATVGQSGNASGPHLHFEYRVKGTAINPREVLPDF